MAHSSCWRYMELKREHHGAELSARSVISIWLHGVNEIDYYSIKNLSKTESWTSIYREINVFIIRFGLKFNRAIGGLTVPYYFYGTGSFEKR